MCAFIKAVFNKKNNVEQPIPEKTKEEKLKALAENPISLKEYLKDYKSVFSKDIDDLWKEQDKDSNGYLNKAEAKLYLEELTKIVDSEKGQYYHPDKFDEMFKKMDEDKNEMLSKSEMSVFIKKAYN